MLNQFSLYTPLLASKSVEYTISQNNINAQMLNVITHCFLFWVHSQLLQSLVQSNEQKVFK